MKKLLSILLIISVSANAQITLDKQLNLQRYLIASSDSGYLSAYHFIGVGTASSPIKIDSTHSKVNYANILGMTGTPSSSTYFRGDGSWQTISASGAAIGSQVTSATAGSVLYAGTNGLLQQSNSHFYYDSTNRRLGVGINSGTGTLNLKAASGNTDLKLTDGSGTETWILAATTAGDYAFAHSSATPFKITRFAPDNSFFINGSGKTGFGTATVDSQVVINGGLRINNGAAAPGYVWTAANADGRGTWGLLTTAGALSATDLTMTAETPSTPSANKAKLFTYDVGGRMLPGFIDPAGLDNALQPLFARNGIKKWLPSGNGTAIVADGAAALTATGTATAASVATTNRHTQIRGLEYLVTVAATTAVAGFREGANQHFFGNTAGNGGFFLVCRFGPATGVATTTNRCFVGMTTSTAAPTDVEPSSLTNMFGVGWDAADANIQFMQNDGTGTATKTSLGIAVPTADRTSVYELAMFCAPNSTTVYYTFKDLAEGGSSVSGNVSTDLPAANTLFSARGYMSVGGTSSVIGIALKSLYIETDY